MQYGDRCRVTSSLKGWYQTPNQHHQKKSLVPEKLVRRDIGPRASMISGPEISTPTASSKKRLLRELLEIVQELSDVNWEDPDPLDISLKSLGDSSLSEGSSADDWEELTPQDPPLGGFGPDIPRPNKKKLKYVPF